MHGYIEVTTQAQLDVFKEVVDEFWDGVVKEVRLLNQFFVPQVGKGIVMGSGFDAQMIFQIPERDFDVEILLCGLKSGVFFPEEAQDGMNCSIRSTGNWPEREISVGELRASEMYYRTRPRSGRAAVLGPEIPTSNAVPATLVEPSWRQCSNCCNAWQERDELRFARCPACERLTDLQAEATNQ